MVNQIQLKGSMQEAVKVDLIRIWTPLQSDISSVKLPVLQYKFWLVESCHVTSKPRPHVIQSPLRITPT